MFFNHYFIGSQQTIKTKNVSIDVTETSTNSE